MGIFSRIKNGISSKANSVLPLIFFRPLLPRRTLRDMPVLGV
jgi:hypothetical protein